MFENIDKKINEEDKASLNNKEGINLLPRSMRRSKPNKAKSNNKIVPKISRSDLHIPAKPNPPKSSKKPAKRLKPKSSKKFSFPILRKLWVALGSRAHKKSASSPAILEMNVIKENAPKVDKSTEKPTKTINAKIDLRPKEIPVIPSRQATLSTKDIDKKKSTFNVVQPEKDDDELDVNLLPKQKKELTPSQKISAYVLVFGLCLLSIITPYLYYKGKNDSYRSGLHSLDSQIASVKKQISDEQKKLKSYGPLAYKLGRLPALFNKHVYLSRFFPTLEKYTSRNVYFTVLSIDSDYKVSLAGQAFNLRSAGEQLIIFKNSPIYSNVSLDSLNYGGQSSSSNEAVPVEISFSFVIDPKVIHDVAVSSNE